jgi:hypothetical protein
MRDEIERHFPGLLALLAATEQPQVANAESAETEADCDPDTSAP